MQGGLMLCEALPELMGHHVGHPTVALGTSAPTRFRSAKPPVAEQVRYRTFTLNPPPKAEWFMG